MKKYQFPKTNILKSVILLILSQSLLNCENDTITSEVVEENTTSTATENEEPDELINITTEETETIDNPTNFTEKTDAEIILDLVNDFRASEGLSQLILNDQLNKAAFDHSNDMLINNYFSHTGLNGSNFSQRIREANYSGSPVAENIASGFRTAEAVFNGWKESEGHRANILSTRATEMGIGESGNRWTQLFGRN